MIAAFGVQVIGELKALRDDVGNLKILGVKSPTASPPLELGIEVVYPADRFGFGHFSQVSLSGRKIRVPEDHLAHDLHRDPGSGCVSGRVAPEIVWSQLDPDRIHAFLTIARTASYPTGNTLSSGFNDFSFR